MALMLLLTFAATVSAKSDNPLVLQGRVKESVFKNDLLKAKVYTIGADGQRCDSLRVGSINPYVITDMHGTTERSEFKLEVPRVDSTYVFEVECEGYNTSTVVYRVEGVGAREKSRTIPVVLLDRAPKKLKEVEVTASKIKFYNRGDTIVYNADAFQLAEGSMLDALIEQLPGVKLEEGGRIMVNGEFVESLLLNGKQFFDGNNNIMLQNIAAYTVKSVEVYNGHTMLEKFHDNTHGPKHLTMDVKLKKEYSIGWIANAQTGYGSESRYLAQLFSAWFNSTTEVVLIANMNNLNDNREPGKSTSWTPERMPTGERRYQLGGLNYRYQSTDGGRFANGKFVYTGNRLTSVTSTDRTNFFTQGNTYDYTYGRRRYKDFDVATDHNFGKRISKVSVSANVRGNYSRTDNVSSNLSAAFDSEQADISMKALETIYSDGSAEQLASLINRSVTRSDGTTKKGAIEGGARMTWRIPGSPDRLSTRFSATYRGQKTETWNDYDIRYGSGDVNDSRKRNYTDGSPNHDMSLSAGTSYNWVKGALSGDFKYDYTFDNRVRDSYMYALERLGEDMGVFGQLPPGYASSLDAGNSYASQLYENKHQLGFSLLYQKKYAGGRSLQLILEPRLGMLHSSIDYYSDDVAYDVKRTTALLIVNNASLRYQWGDPGKKQVMQIVTLKYGHDTNTPDLMHMIDVRNTSDPLNIALGNPGLKNSHVNRFGLVYITIPRSVFRNSIMVDYDMTDNALVRGYYYDMGTGVRYNKTYNVDGNHSAKVQNQLNIEFGRRKEFSLTSTTDAGFSHNVDMVGTDGVEPSPSKVDTRTLGESVKLSWKIGRQTVSLKGSVTDRHTTSTRADFRTIDATHYNYGLTGVFALPAGFGISTDFTFYTRWGYGARQLDTTDAVWNARLTYTPKGGRWVIKLDGFDLLHRLSNVHYAINATGRTVTYTNTLPRYVLLSAQYRLNINPKKR